MNFNITNKYHATNSYFVDFEESSDIGFHFGSKKAATDRLKAIGGKPKVTIEKISFPATNPFGIGSNDENSDNVVKRAIAIIIPRLNSPTSSAVAKVKQCNTDELLDFISEYSSKPISASYKRLTENIGNPDEYSILVGGTAAIKGISDSKKAKELKKEVSNSFLKKVNLSLKNPIRLDDLGTWSPHSFCLALGLDQSTTSDILSCNEPKESYSKIRSLILSLGHDGIVYSNAVEGSGDSYIVFDKSQIEVINSPKPSIEGTLTRE